MKAVTTAGSKYNRRIVIQAPDQMTAKDSAGGALQTWSTVNGCSSVPANFSYPLPSKKGDEAFLLQQVQEAVFVTITIRYRPSTNISPAYRVLYGSGTNQRIFNIRSVFVDDEDRRTIIMQCQELQAKGTLHQ